MLHKMSEVRGWSHDEMMKMPKSLFYRYYGYWYQERLVEEEIRKRDEQKQKRESRKNQPRSWKPL
jgi:hypothetical protein